MTGKTQIRRPQSLRTATKGAVSLAAIGASMLMAGVAQAQTAADQSKDEIALDTMRVEDTTLDTNPYAQKGAPYKARVSGDARHVEPLAKTPQTIVVVTQSAIQDQGVTDLRDVVAAQPGITVGTGENGNAFGDRYIIRGQEARSDVFIDGLRDAGMTTRESFAVEQIEISKGPNSTFAGRGTAGGAINSITKKASTDYNFNRVSAGVGTDEFYRVTLDSNLAVTDTLAVRANLLKAYQEVPDRGPAERDRTGVALSASWDLTPKFNLTGDYYRLEAQDIPDLGSYMVGTAPARAPDPNPPVYAQTNDFLNTEVDAFTLRGSYEFAPNFRIANSARYTETTNEYWVSGAAAATQYTNAGVLVGPTVRLSTHQGWQEVEYFADNLNAYWDVNTGPLAHKFVFGAEYSDLSVLNGVYPTTAPSVAANNCRIATGAGVNTGFCIVSSGALIANANSAYHPVAPVRGVSDSDYNIKTISLYAMDTVDLSDNWSVFAGVRRDEYDYENTVGTTTKTTYSDDDGFWSGHLGLVYKPNEDTSLYATYSSAAEINGGESDVGSSCDYGGICVPSGGLPAGVTANSIFESSKPERSNNFEVGAKLQFFDEKALFTVAMFQTTKTDVMEATTGASYTTSGSLNTGENVVKGIEFGLVGNFTDKLSGQLGLAIMDSEVTESATAANIGLPLSNFAEQSAIAQLRYAVTKAFAVGGTVRYRSEVYTGQPDTAANYNAAISAFNNVVPEYTALDLFATYDFNEKTNLRLNVNNVTDEDIYLAAYRSGSFVYIGDRTNARLTVSVAF